ncbi:hypothetical protein GGE56_006568 [Rhizobium leguminosarum]|nr:hypothetical protein [Rhizobium leguminosarum]MBB6298227.1 hypothetical protein [Rhizobium leguminosarum]
MADLIQFLDVMLSPVGILTMVTVFCAGGFAGAALVGGRG